MEGLICDDVIVWYDVYYVLNDVVLIIVGDVMLDCVCELVEIYYGLIFVKFDSICKVCL